MPHVLVVDDYPGICPVVQMALEALGDFRVSSALTADEALPILDRDRPDLIILDAVMPGMRSIDLAADAAARAIPLILMTGEEVASEGLTGVGWRHLDKPFRLDTLLAEVRATLAAVEQNLAMVRNSLGRLRRMQEEHHRAYDLLRESWMRSRAARARRQGDKT